MHGVLLVLLFGTGPLLSRGTPIQRQKEIGNTFPDSPRYVQVQWTAQDGLPVNSVNDIVQTEDKYLWLATYDGLVRFDGTEFETYRSSQYEALPSNRIIELRARSDGLWLRTESRHLVRFHDGHFTTVGENVRILRSGPDGKLWVGLTQGLAVYRDGQLRRVAPNRIQADVRELLFTDDGALWIGTWSQGGYLRRADGQVRHLTVDQGLPGPRLFALAEGENGTVWLGTLSGMARWKEGHLTRVRTADSWSKPISILDVRTGVQGTCWASTDRGIYRCRSDRLVPFISLEPETVELPIPERFIQEGPDGHVWTAIDRTLYQGQTPVFEAENFIEDVLRDHEGNLWVATSTQGLFRLRRSLFTMYGEPEGLESGNVYPVLQRQDGSVWLGTLGGGLVHLRGGDPVTYHVERGEVKISNVWALHEDRSGRFWVGGTRLCRFEAGTCARADTPGPVTGTRIRAIYEDRQGRLWVGTEDGLYRGQDPLERDSSWTKFTPENSRLPHPFVRTIHEMPDGSLWFGTNGGGLARWKDGRFTAVTTEDGLSSNLVRDIFQDSTGVLWVATEDRGLNRLVLSENEATLAGDVTIYRKEDGLFDNALHQILKDEQGRFWISTNRGIFWVEKSQLVAFARGTTDRVQSVSYTTKDGLRSREANGGIQPAGIESVDGRFWFPTQKGAAVVNPEEIEKRIPPPPVLIEAIASGDSVVSRRVGGTVTLAADQRDFDVEYTAIRLADPGSLVFRYRLRGLRAEWVQVGERREAIFTNVPPGKYVFEVSAKVRQGVWSEPAQLTLTVAPYFYETWWFYALCVLGIGLLGYGVVRYRTYALRRRERELNRMVEERTEELAAAKEEAERMNELKSSFLANMSHEIRTPLTSVIGFAEAIGNEATSGEAQDTSIAQFADLIDRSGRRLLETLNSILNLSKLEAGEMEISVEPIDLAAEAREVAELFGPQAEKAEIALHVEGPDQPLRGWADEGALRIVLRNLVGNALKYTEDGGTVWIRVREEGEEVAVEVEDTGIGIDPERVPRLFRAFEQEVEGQGHAEGGSGLGLAVTKRLIEQMDSRIEVETEKGEGSRFTVLFTAVQAESEVPA